MILYQKGTAFDDAPKSIMNADSINGTRTRTRISIKTNAHAHIPCMTDRDKENGAGDVDAKHCPR